MKNLILIISVMLSIQTFGFETTQEAIYCQNAINQKLNCNYQISHNGFTETSVSISGYSQYVVQQTASSVSYAKIILSEDIKEDSLVYTIKADGSFEVNKVVFTSKGKIARPVFKVTQDLSDKFNFDKLEKEMFKIRSITNKFSSEYIVPKDSFSPEQ